MRESSAPTLAKAQAQDPPHSPLTTKQEFRLPTTSLLGSIDPETHLLRVGFVGREFGRARTSGLLVAGLNQIGFKKDRIERLIECFDELFCVCRHHRCDEETELSRGRLKFRIADCFEERLLK